MFRQLYIQSTCIAGLWLVLAGCSASDPLDEDEYLSAYRREVEPLAESLAPSYAAGDVHGEPQPAPAPTITPESTLDDCIVYALLHSPEVQAAYYLWQADAERINQAKALPDPMFMFGQVLTTSEMRYAASISQMVPSWGKRELRGQEAGEMADAGRKRFEASALALRYRVAGAFYELQYVADAAALTRENTELLQSLEKVATAQYQVATASQADLIRIQIELAELQDRLAQLADLQASLAARLNAAMNRPHDAPVPFGRAIEPMQVTASADELLAMLGDSNPELHGMEHEIDAARIGTELARRERLPDFTFGLGFEDMRETEGDMTDPLMLSISINLPIWREKNDAQLGESIARRLSLSADRLGRFNMLSSELNEALYEHRDANRRIVLYRDALLPKADQSLSSLLALYQAGRGGFLDVLDSERTLLEFRLARQRAAADSAIAVARLDMIVGRPVPVEMSASTAAQTPQVETNP